MCPLLLFKKAFGIWSQSNVNKLGVRVILGLTMLVLENMLVDVCWGVVGWILIRGYLVMSAAEVMLLQLKLISFPSDQDPGDLPAN